MKSPAWRHDSDKNWGARYLSVCLSAGSSVSARRSGQDAYRRSPRWLPTGVPRPLCVIRVILKTHKTLRRFFDRGREVVFFSKTFISSTISTIQLRESLMFSLVRWALTPLQHILTVVMIFTVCPPRSLTG